MEDIVDSGRRSWYEGGYRINIVTYTIAKLAYDVRKAGGELDLERVWLNQDAGQEIAGRLEQLAPHVQASLLLPPPGVKNVGEWCKKEACWESIAELKLPWEVSVRAIAITKEIHESKKVEGKKKGLVDDGIGLQAEVLRLSTSGYWAALYLWCGKNDLFSPTDRSLVQKASTTQGFLKIGLEKDWKKLMASKKIAEDEGFRHAGK